MNIGLGERMRAKPLCSEFRDNSLQLVVREKKKKNNLTRRKVSELRDENI